MHQLVPTTLKCNSLSDTKWWGTRIWLQGVNLNMVRINKSDVNKKKMNRGKMNTTSCVFIFHIFTEVSCSHIYIAAKMEERERCIPQNTVNAFLEDEWMKIVKYFDCFEADVKKNFLTLWRGDGMDDIVKFTRLWHSFTQHNEKHLVVLSPQNIELWTSHLRNFVLPCMGNFYVCNYKSFSHVHY